MRVVSVKSVRKTYKRGKIVAIDDVTFDVEKQDIAVFVGPDGSGKSTLFKIVSGVLEFDSGDVRVLGVNLKEKGTEALGDRIAFMPQGLGLNLYHRLTVEENIDFFAELHQMPEDLKERRKELLLKTTGLFPFKNRVASKLSGGMMQKLAICCSLIHTPELIILDEPTMGIDPVSRFELWKLLFNFVREEGITVLISTSYLDEAEKGTKLFLLKSGKIISSTTPENLINSDMPVYEVRGKDIEKAYEVALKRFKIPRIKGNVLRFIAEDLSPLKGLNVEIEKVKPKAEDLFLTFTGIRRLSLRPIFTFKGEIPEEAVRTENLTKKFGNFTAVDSVSLTIKRGEIFGLLGPNGAGKTTLIKMLVGLHRKTSGMFKVAGSENMSRIRRIIGYMSQKFSLYPDMTVYENLILWGRIYGVNDRELKVRIDESMRVMNLEEFKNVLVEDLPLGIKQRVALISSVLHAPGILFLDEPTSGVDPSERDVFWQVIRFLSKKMGITVLVTTHYMDEAEYCDRVSLMNRGKIISIGSPDDLKRRAITSIGNVYELITKNPFQDYEKLIKIGFNVMTVGRRIRVYSKEKLSKEDFEKMGIIPISLRESEITMEEVFIDAVKKSEGNSC
jgi:ABC-2 type transport system ATP-binding protein/ribosome-dependent ATPase